MKEIVKNCKIHGDLTREQIRIDGSTYRCKACRIESNKKSYYLHREKRVSSSIRWKQQNKGDYAEWCRQDRKNNPDKYRRYEQNSIKKHGIEKIRKKEVSRIHGLTVEEYDLLIKSQKNKCSICDKEETRLGRDGKTITPLCIDHCHFCETRGVHFIRGLLCRACNTAIGHFKDDISLLKSAILYLEKHAHTEMAK